jgi:hypothetical protein
MQFTREQLLELALKCPWWMFTGEEIAELCNVSITVVSLVRKEPDHPFFLNKSRPEWFIEWTKSHHSFLLNRGGRENLSKKIDPRPSQSVQPDRSSSKNIKGRPRS